MFIKATVKSDIQMMMPVHLPKFFQRKSSQELVANYIKAMDALNDRPLFRSERWTKKKCSRCHASFTDESNGPSDCALLHDVSFQPQSIKGNAESGRWAAYECRYCRLSFELPLLGGIGEEKAALNDVLIGQIGHCTHCIKRHHTTSPYKFKLLWGEA